MTATLVKRHVALTALFALMFMRFIDLAVFDIDHEHIKMSHVQVHASEIAHSHNHGEPTEHDSLDGKSAHAGFHTLLNVFLDVDPAQVPERQRFNSRFGLMVDERAHAYGNRPPIPPPLV